MPEWGWFLLGAAIGLPALRWRWLDQRMTRAGTRSAEWLIARMGKRKGHDDA